MKGPGSKPDSTSSSQAQARKPLVEPLCDRGSGNIDSGREYASVGFRSIKQDSWLPRKRKKAGGEVLRLRGGPPWVKTLISSLPVVTDWLRTSVAFSFKMCGCQS